MAPNDMTRREFFAPLAASSAFMIVPRHVLGGPGYVAPSDKLLLASVGCGTQATRELMSMIQHPQVQITAVCDAVKDGTNYVDWSKTGIRDSIRRLLNDPSYGDGVNGIRAGRDQFQEIVQRYYAQARNLENYKVASYADFRELLEKERDLDAVKIMTPDHLHATVAIAAMNKKKAVLTHKPLANRLSEVRLVVETARKTGVPTHLLAYHAAAPALKIRDMIADGAIGTLREIHDWTDRPCWPQVESLPKDNPPVPAGMDYPLWLGPCTDRPYHPSFTHAVFRGWYEFGGGSIADMGNYSMWPIFTAFELPAPTLVEAQAGISAEIVDGVSTNNANDFAFSYSNRVRFKFPAHGKWPALDLYWYDGGMRPYTPDELLQDGRTIPSAGTMYVGDKGVILDGSILPESRMKEYVAAHPEAAPPERGGQRAQRVPGANEDVWVKACLGGPASPGNFLNASNCSEAIALGALAMRATRKNFRQGRASVGPLKYDPGAMKITNYAEANAYMYREYREGWQLPVARQG